MLTRTRHWALGLMCTVAGCAIAIASEVTPQQQAEILQKVSAAFVRVEFELQYDQGEPPVAAGWAERCPNCGQFHSAGNGEQLVREQRPHEVSGLLIAPNRVVTIDPQIQTRFLKQITVRAGDRAVGATLAAYALDENALLLELNEPLTTTAPLTFERSRPGPHFAVTAQHVDGTRKLTVQPLGGQVVLNDGESPRRTAPAPALIVTGEGQPLGVTFTGELPVDDSWQKSPSEWAALTADELTKTLASVRATAERGLLHVTLRFRSPRATLGRHWQMGYGEQSPTEKHAIGIVIRPDTLLIPAQLDPATTARLESIQAKLPGEVVSGKFAGSLRDTGCLLATFDQPLGPASQVYTQDIRTLRREMLIGVEARPYGEGASLRAWPARIATFTAGLKRLVMPSLSQDAEHLYLFTRAGELVAAPVQIRALAPTEAYGGDDEPVTMPIAMLAAQLADVAAHLDPSNVPLSEAEEARIAWLGVELQGLDEDLARAHGVSEITQNGTSGALVAHVYPGSPAAEHGVEAGWVLLRLLPESHPQPIPVRSDDEYDGMPFPWEQLDDLPEEYFDEMPVPWPPLENSLNRAITVLGFGQKFVAELFHNGEVRRLPFVVTQSPTHFATAARFKSDELLGLTVRDLTFEVRRYMQMAEKEPGVVISKIEKGSLASVAGLKPYEVITHVNGEPVRDVAAFERALSAADELRLDVQRMSESRVVKIFRAPAGNRTEPIKSTAAAAEAP